MDKNLPALKADLQRAILDFNATIRRLSITSDPYPSLRPQDKPFRFYDKLPPFRDPRWPDYKRITITWAAFRAAINGGRVNVYMERFAYEDAGVRIVGGV